MIHIKSQRCLRIARDMRAFLGLSDTLNRLCFSVSTRRISNMAPTNNTPFQNASKYIKAEEYMWLTDSVSVYCVSKKNQVQNLLFAFKYTQEGKSDLYLPPNFFPFGKMYETFRWLGIIHVKSAVPTLWQLIELKYGRISNRFELNSELMLQSRYRQLSNAVATVVCICHIFLSIIYMFIVVTRS